MVPGFSSQARVWGRRVRGPHCSSELPAHVNMEDHGGATNGKDILAGAFFTPTSAVPSTTTTITVVGSYHKALYRIYK